MENLPDDIFYLLYQYLNEEDSFNFMRTCKKSYNSLTDRERKKQLRHIELVPLNPRADLSFDYPIKCFSGKLNGKMSIPIITLNYLLEKGIIESIEPISDLLTPFMLMFCYHSSMTIFEEDVSNNQWQHFLVNLFKRKQTVPLFTGEQGGRTYENILPFFSTVNTEKFKRMKLKPINWFSINGTFRDGKLFGEAGCCVSRNTTWLGSAVNGETDTKELDDHVFHYQIICIQEDNEVNAIVTPLRNHESLNIKMNYKEKTCEVSNQSRNTTVSLIFNDEGFIDGPITAGDKVFMFETGRMTHIEYNGSVITYDKEAEMFFIDTGSYEIGLPDSEDCIKFLKKKE